MSERVAVDTSVLVRNIVGQLQKTSVTAPIARMLGEVGTSALVSETLRLGWHMLGPVDPHPSMSQPMPPRAPDAADTGAVVKLSSPGHAPIAFRFGKGVSNLYAAAMVSGCALMFLGILALAVKAIAMALFR